MSPLFGMVYQPTVHSDQVASVESEIIKELTNMKHSHTTPYHPQGNALAERFNRTLLERTQERLEEIHKFISLCL